MLFAPAPAPPDTLHLGPYPQLTATRYTANDGLPAEPIVDVGLNQGRVYARFRAGWLAFDGERWTAVPSGPPAQAAPPDAPPGGAPLSAARTRAGAWWAVTPSGAWRQAGGKWAPLDLPRLYRPRQPSPNIDTTVRQVVVDAAGTVWLATDYGVCATDGADWWHPLDRRDGMPYEDVLCLTVGANGDVWGGTSQGAWRLRNGQWRYFWGKRWLPGNRVNAVAVAVDGTAWLATDGGVARIEERTIRLADKAAHYEEVTAARHDRRGYVTSCGLKKAGDPTGGIVPEASDNDGLWTAVYIGAEAFRYAATHDAKAAALATHSMGALLDLVRLSGVPGFPARAIIRKGEAVSGYSPDETVRVEGETDKIWYAPAGHPDLLCKGDTSSDELDGHYFAWYVYHDLVADEAQKREAATVVAAVTDNLLQHDFTLVGHTGRKTRWGVFSPQHLNDDPRWLDERGLNSIEMLCYLKVAHHITGEQRFADAYEDLISGHHYLLNTLNYRHQVPWWAVNHSDDQLAFLVYYPLLMLERDPARRAILTRSIASTWDGLRDEHATLFDFIYRATTGAPCEMEASVDTLRDWPWDLVDWDVRATHRHDVTLKVARGIVGNELDRVLPAGERRLMRWNGNPFEADGGSGGTSEEDASAWLLPYWMGRYHGIIAE